MKQRMLQMLISVYGNFKKLKLFIEFIKKFIRKIIGVQKHGKRRHNLGKVIFGILYYIKSGCQWRLLPRNLATGEQFMGGTVA